jgi:hypothetical protein
MKTVEVKISWHYPFKEKRIRRRLQTYFGAELGVLGMLYKNEI